MKILVVYSSKTGNTKMIAEAIKNALGEVAVLKNVSEVGDITAYERIIAGFWVDKSTANGEMRDFLSELHGKRVALFTTMGAYPMPPYSEKCLENAAAVIPKDNIVIAERFACMGKVDPHLLAEMAKMFPQGHPHSMTPERKARLEEAAKHPNAKDLADAAEFAKKAEAALNA